MIPCRSDAMRDMPDASSASPQGNRPPSEPNSPSTAISLTVNGVRHSVAVEDRWTLVELLRDQLDLTGTKLGCDRSECGACTVLLNGQPVYACSHLAVWADGADVQTVEGLAHNGRLSPLQQAFIEHNAPQCGFCTPGQLMTATALLNTVPRPDAAQVKQALVGNLCRCANYNAIVGAVDASTAMPSKRSRGSGAISLIIRCGAWGMRWRQSRPPIGTSLSRPWR